MTPVGTGRFNLIQLLARDREPLQLLVQGSLLLFGQRLERLLYASLDTE